MKITSKQMVSASKKCREERKSTWGVKKAIERGNAEGARIMALRGIREKNSGLNYLKFVNRMRAQRLVPCSKIKQKSIVKVNKGPSALKSMNVEKISKEMDAFENSSRRYNATK